MANGKILEELLIIKGGRIMKKKVVSLLLCVAMAATLIAGCGKSSDNGKGSASGAKTEKSDSLVMPVSATVTSLNGNLETMAEGAFQLAPYQDELYYVDQDETRWYLADSCEISEDGLTYTLKLKDNLKWHDGEAITADDVIFTFNCNLDTNNGAGFSNVVFVGENQVKAEKVDDLTVKFTLPEVSASYYSLLGNLVLIPEHAFGGDTNIKSADANLTDIGSGPYKLVEFKDGESLVLEKFEDYYGDEPQIEKIIFKVISDPSAQEVAFKNGEINFLTAASDNVVTEVEKTEGVALHTLAEGRVKYLAWNKYCPTWENRDAVKAVFMALNQEEIVKGAYGEHMGVAANSIFSNRNTFYDETVKGYEQNLDEAKKLAKSSGLAGKTIKLHYNTDRSFMEATALLIQEQLKAIDVNVELQGIDANGFFDVVFTDQADYELYLNEYGAIGDPDNVVAGMLDGTWGINVDTPQEILDLFEKARRTTDVEERTAIYKEVQQKASEAYLIYPIAYPSYCFATSDNLEGTEDLSTTPVFEDYTKLSFK